MMDDYRCTLHSFLDRNLSDVHINNDLFSAYSWKIKKMDLVQIGSGTSLSCFQSYFAFFYSYQIEVIVMHNNVKLLL